MSVKIPENLMAKLKEAVPGVEILVDESQSDRFSKDGNFDELLFRRYLLDKKRASVYRRVSDKGQSITSDLLSDGEKSIIESVKEFSQFMWGDISELLDVENKISEVIGEYSIEKNRNNIQGIKNSINDSISTWKQELDDAVNLFSTQMDAAKEDLIYKFRSFDDSKVNAVRSFIAPQISKFKQENKRAAEEMKRIIGDNLKSVLNDKISKLDESRPFSVENLQLTDEEEKKLSEEVKGMVATGIQNQRQLRRETVNGFLSKTANIKGKEELIQYIRDSQDISEESKRRLEEIISSDYLTKQDIKDSLENKPSSNRDLIRDVEYSVSWDMRSKKERLENIYNSDIWKFCNGGWWAVLAHIGTLGFCTGFTATAAIVEAVEGDIYRLTTLMGIVAMIGFMLVLPIWFPAFGKFAWLIIATNRKIQDLIFDALKKAINDFIHYKPQWN